MSNPLVSMTLDEAVTEVLSELYGVDLTYRPELDTYRSITRALNKATRLNALEHEWSWYFQLVDAGTITLGQQAVVLDNDKRPRMVGDDSVQIRDTDGSIIEWAYFLPRDALPKYRYKHGLWCSAVGQTVSFSRPFIDLEVGMHVFVPCMREPAKFVLPPMPENPGDAVTTVPDETREQLVDFVYPDVVIMRAAYLYAQTDPVIQPRVQTLEAQYKDLMYQVIERDDRNTDTPYQNEWNLALHNGIGSRGHGNLSHLHPHSDAGYN